MPRVFRERLFEQFFPCIIEVNNILNGLEAKPLVSDKLFENSRIIFKHRRKIISCLAFCSHKQAKVCRFYNFRGV